jgi:2-phosphosulfolactate phosphatase
MTGTFVNCEWGAAGIEHLRHVTDVYVIVDVLSFTTCVDIAVSRGAWIYPYTWNDMSSAEFVNKIGAAMAVSSRKPGFSLSPVTLLEIPTGTKLVLPSPNGSTLSLLTGDLPTLAGCLRNAAAVARSAQQMGKRISVIPGGERWRSGELRVAIEDWLGAGAIISNLEGDLSAEARMARLAFEAGEDLLAKILEQSISGRELIEKGRLRDIHLAADLNSSTCAPILREGAYRES